ncbi:hypothetical protein Mgra_00003683 [Meloidogyne graminicola]|uniref:Small ribosomal subunit protein mS31 n=1 Tax=Meloidogyne graminicola TaxID=189291 RepID=A0A8S9ZUY1_9BILA|nr:hypothetical protein Mgra_00003683 [Meloidogyne graminicola]
MSNPRIKAIDSLATVCKEVIQNELKTQFAFDYFDNVQELTKSHYKDRKRREGTVTDRSFKKFFSKKALTQSIFFNQAKELKEKKLLYWNHLDETKMQLLDRGLGPRNIIEEQIEWTKKGKMWPYPIDNEFLLGEEENVSFVDHVFLESELAKHKLPRSEAIEHYMELVLTGLSKNPYMSVEKKHEHIRWFADYLKKCCRRKI